MKDARVDHGAFASPRPRSARLPCATGYPTTPTNPIHRVRAAIDSPVGRRLYSQRIATVEPVFGNLRHNNRLNRFTLLGKDKVGTQWRLFCLVHNIEKMANSGKWA